MKAALDIITKDRKASEHDNFFHIYFGKYRLTIYETKVHQHSSVFGVNGLYEGAAGKKIKAGYEIYRKTFNDRDYIAANIIVKHVMAILEKLKKRA